MTERVTKAHLGGVVKAVDDGGPAGGFEVVLSAPTLDRDKEVVDPHCFDPLPDHITMDIDHGMSVRTTVGSGTPSYDADGNLVVTGTWASTPLAQETRTLVKEGHIRTTSVAFIRGKTTRKDGIAHVTSGELLNGTFTPVPSNRESVVLSAKGFTVVKEGRRNSAADAQRLQDAHDLLVECGAACGTGKSARRPAVKAIEGSVEALSERVADALEDAYSDDDPYSWWGYIRGVIPTGPGKGRVIFDSSKPGDGTEWATWQQDFTDDGSVVTLVGEPVEVDIHEIVVPDADANRETDDTPPAKGAGRAGTPPGVPARPAPDAGGSDDGSHLRTVQQARARLIHLAATGTELSS